MRKRLAILVAVTALLLAGAAPVGAHAPCNDAGDGDGNPSGREYAEFHIAEFAKLGDLGNKPGGLGHKPGGHMGFSACLGVH